MSKTEKLIYLALLVALALILGLIEKNIPVPFLGPGAKLGLANIITVFALYHFRFSEVLTVVILRILLLTMFSGNLSSFFYSISGGLLSFFVMFLLLRLFSDRIGTIGLSVAGAVFHNIGQIAIAALVVQNINMVLYFPVLMMTGIGTGIFVGLTAQLLLSHMRKLSVIKL